MFKNSYLLTILLIIYSCGSTSSTVNQQKDSKENLNLAKHKFGIEVADLTQEINNDSGLSHGVFITNVYAFYPASKAGIKKGDIIVTLDTNNVLTVKDFTEILQSYKYKYGQVSLGIFRDNQIEKIKVYLE